MEHKKGFIKGALTGALLTLLVVSLAACGLQHIDEGIISSDTETKLSHLKKLIDETYLHDVKEKDLNEGIYKGYVEGLGLSLIHISEPTRLGMLSRMPSSA